MFVYETLGEMIRFFHQPMHWPAKADVERFMSECYYKKLYEWTSPIPSSAARLPAAINSTTASARAE